jgi:hypothetical protein
MTPSKAKQMLATAEKAEGKARAKLEAAQKEHDACVELVTTLRKMAGLPAGETPAAADLTETGLPPPPAGCSDKACPSAGKVHRHAGNVIVEAGA